MGRTLKILEIIQPILTEVGDLKNIKPYKYKSVSSLQTSFQTERDHLIDVELERLKLGTTVKSIDIPPALIKSPNLVFFYISFSVNGIDYQHIRSDFKYLIRILKTVAVIVAEMIEGSDRNQQKDTYQNIYLVGSIDKTGELQSERQQDLLYYAVISKNLPSGLLHTPHFQFLFLPMPILLRLPLSLVFGFRKLFFRSQPQH